MSGGHRIDVSAAVDFPDGSRRVMFACQVPDCVHGHVEASPAGAADVVVARLAVKHEQGGDAVVDGAAGMVPWV